MLYAVFLSQIYNKMGASGNLSIISLEDYEWEDIKKEMLNQLIERCPNYSDPKNECEEYYFKVANLKNINEFIWLFSNKIVDYCPEENGIFINNNFYDGWAGKSMPQIIENHLIIYDTDQQMSYQNLPTECLRNLINSSFEIWT